MAYPRVKTLRYKLKTEEGFRYEDAPAVEVARAAFDLHLAGDVATVTLKDQYASTDAAREQVEPFLRDWELAEGLRRDRQLMWFEYVGAEVEQGPGAELKTSVASAHMGAFLRGEIRVSVAAHQYPPPPLDFVRSPDVERLWARYEACQQGREPLPSMVYYCLTAFTSSAGSKPILPGRTKPRMIAADKYQVADDVLHTLNELASVGGDDRTARKGRVGTRPLSDKEAEWVRSAVKGLIRQLGRYAADPINVTPLTMADLPPLA